MRALIYKEEIFVVIIMNPEATSQNIDEVIRAIKSVGLDAKIVRRRL